MWATSKEKIRGKNQKYFLCLSSRIFFYLFCFCQTAAKMSHALIYQIIFFRCTMSAAAAAAAPKSLFFFAPGQDDVL